MEKFSDSLQASCLNCGTSIKGTFCHHCGQSARDNSDRSLTRLLGDFLGNVFFFDRRFLISVRYLFLYPGRMTVEFLEGKRKKFISPVTLFLFFNLIYFFVNPLSDYSLSLYDQMYSQPYSQYTKEWVDAKFEREGLSEQVYSVIYQNTSDNISRSIMIINVPIIALFLYLIAFKKRRFYFDHLIFTFHFFSVFIASWVMLDWANKFIFFVSGTDDSIASNISSNLFILYVPLFYAMLSIKKFMNIRWYWAIPASIWVIVSITLANLIYRFIIFTLTFLLS